MPTPPARAKDWAYCSVSIERQTPVPCVLPNGPSPFSPAVISENIELRNIASKLVATDLAFACALGETFSSAAANSRSGRLLMTGMLKLVEMWLEEPTGVRRITSPRYRPGSRQRP